MIPLTNEEINEAVAKLPSLPTIVLEVIEAIDKGDVNTSVLAYKISHDQTLTTKLLGLANSSFYGMQSKVGSIPHAIAILGFNSLRLLLVTAAIIKTFSGTKSNDLDYAEFWRHSIATALSAKAIANKIGANEGQAFIGGLLHYIGRLVLASYSPSCYQEVLNWRFQHGQDLMAAEMHVFGIDHRVAGQAALVYWNFPGFILETLDIFEAGHLSGHSQAASVVSVANAIAYGLDISGGKYDRVPIVYQSEWDMLKLSDEMLIEIFGMTERQSEEIFLILDIARKKGT